MAPALAPVAILGAAALANVNADELGSGSRPNEVIGLADPEHPHNCTQTQPNGVYRLIDWIGDEKWCETFCVSDSIVKRVNGDGGLNGTCNKPHFNGTFDHSIPMTMYNEDVMVDFYGELTDRSLESPLNERRRRSRRRRSRRRRSRRRRDRRRAPPPPPPPRPAPRPSPSPAPRPSPAPAGGQTLKVFHVMDGGASGLDEKNAATAQYDLFFIATQRCERYWSSGVVEMATVKVDQFKAYARCNHPDGSNVYTCEGGDKEYAGHDTQLGRYSFPRKGKNKHWWELGMVRKSVRGDIYPALGCSGNDMKQVCKCVKRQCKNVGGFLKPFGMSSAPAPGGCPAAAVDTTEEDYIMYSNTTDVVV